MRILSVNLKNFKSHREAHFEFEPGTNAICGENGAGKTSILEAIAWVLFDHNPYSSYEDLIRSGSKQAEVAVMFISAYDDRTYEIRRHTHTGYQIFDPQLQYRLEYERKSDVLKWLRQNLGVPSGTDLPHLFTSTIGVPQGLFTADFLKTEQDRKKVFDGVLKVEEYTTIYKDLRSIEKFSEAQLSELKHQLELLNLQLKDWDHLQNEQKNLSLLQANQKGLLEIHQKNAESLEKEINTLNRLSIELNHQEVLLQESHHHLSLKILQFQQAQEAFTKAEQAQDHLRIHHNGFKLFEAAEAKLQELDIQSQERQHYLIEREQILTQDEDQKIQLTRLQERLSRLDDCEAQIAILEPQLLEQESLEKKLKDLQDIYENLGDLHQQLNLLRIHWDNQRKNCKQRQQEKDIAQQAQDLCQQLLSSHQAFLNTEEHLAILEAKRQERNHLFEQRELVHRQQHGLELQQAGLEEKLDRFKHLEAAIISLQPCVQQQISLEQKQKEVQEKLLHFESLRLKLSQQQEEQKDTAQKYKTLKNTLQKRKELQKDIESIVNLEQTIDRINTQLSRVSAAKQFQAEIQIIVDQGHRNLVEYEQQVNTVFNLLETNPLRETFSTLLNQGAALNQGILSQLEGILEDISQQVSTSKLKNQLQHLKQKLTQCYQARGLAEQIPELEIEIEALKKKQEILEESIADLLWNLEAEETFVRQLQEIETQLSAIADPRTQIQVKQQEMKQKDQVIQDWQQIQKELNQVKQDLDHLNQQLIVFSSLDSDISSYQKKLQHYRSDHQTYLKTYPLAQTLSQKQADFLQAETVLEELEQQGKQVQQQISQLENVAGSRDTISAEQSRLIRDLQQLQDPRNQIKRLQHELSTRSEIEEQYQNLISQQSNIRQILEQLEQKIAKTDDLNTTIQYYREQRESHRLDYDLYRQALPLAENFPLAQDLYQKLKEEVNILKSQQDHYQQERDKLAQVYDPGKHENLKKVQQEIEIEKARLQVQIESVDSQLQRVESRIQHLKNLQEDQKKKENILKEKEKLHRFIKFSREVFKKAGPRITKLYLQQVNLVADRLFREILNRSSISLMWEASYDITIQEMGRAKRRFKSLSGGEQMAAALSVRLALLKVLGELDIAFFDEPTTNMDQQRRQRLAEAITQIKSFEQLFVISHDGSFEQITENIIHLTRQDPAYGA
jgi:exonuclease SbcC